MMALIFGMLLAWLIQPNIIHLPASYDIATIGSRFGGIPQCLPKPQWPGFNGHEIRELVRPATTIALLAAIESLPCCVVADGMLDDRHDAQQELLAQGLAKILSQLIGRIS